MCNDSFHGKDQNSRCCRPDKENSRDGLQVRPSGIARGAVGQGQRVSGGGRGGVAETGVASQGQAKRGEEMNDDTRIYEYQNKIIDHEGRVVHLAGERVHQTKDSKGSWRDTEVLEEREVKK